MHYVHHITPADIIRSPPLTPHTQHVQHIIPCAPDIINYESRTLDHLATAEAAQLVGRRFNAAYTLKVGVRNQPRWRQRWGCARRGCLQGMK